MTNYSCRAKLAHQACFSVAFRRIILLLVTYKPERDEWHSSRSGL